MNNVRYTIYKLIDPITNEIRYIGLTFNNLKQRLKSHCSEKSKSHKSNWIQSLKKQGLKPVIESIEDNILSYVEVCEREIFYINKYKSEGHRLTNMASGGNKNKKMSDETRKKMSDSAKNRAFKLVLSEETKTLISEKTKKRFESESEREKLRISNRRYEDSKTEEQKINDILIQNPKKVYQYDKNMNFISEYISIRDAERKTNINRSNISKCCMNKVKSAGGFIWRYE
jgi:group I intron endonuclease